MQERRNMRNIPEKRSSAALGNAHCAANVWLAAKVQILRNGWYGLRSAQGTGACAHTQVRPAPILETALELHT